MFFLEEDQDDPSTGVVLSGGQWQRPVQARVFFRAQRDLMILDEPSAGLDAQAEQEIHAVRGHAAQRTCLLISHRLNAVRDADQVVVLTEGRVTEQGDHDALMAAGGEYARLVTMRASGHQTATG